MSFFNKVRTFPEYHDTLDAIDAMTGHVTEMGDKEHDAFSDNYNLFYSGQPEAIRPQLRDILDTGMVLTQNVKEYQFVLLGFKAKYDSLRQLQERLLSDFNKLNTKKEEAKKAKEAANKEDTKLQQYKAKGKQADIAKQERTAELAREKAEHLENIANQAHKEYQEIQASYRKNFSLSFALSTQSLVAARKEKANACITLGEKFAEIGSKFENYEDELVVKLRQRLELWEQEQV